MFDLSWGEVMVIGAVALIVIGPKDLPKALRTVGNMTSKVRRMASEFQGQFQEAMRIDERNEQAAEFAEFCCWQALLRECPSASSARTR